MNIDDISWLAQRLVTLDTRLAPCSGGEIEVAEDGSAIFNARAARRAVNSLLSALGGRLGPWEKAPRYDALPMIAIWPDQGVKLVHGVSQDGAWLLEGRDGPERYTDLPQGAVYSTPLSSSSDQRATPFRAMFSSALRLQRWPLVQVALATLFCNLLALAASLYSMHVYDRVIPAQSTGTLLILTAGVLMAALLEMILRGARSAILMRAWHEVDLDLAHRMFLRLFNIRMDQFPASVATLSSQLRGYEAVRAFGSSGALYLLVDLPFALLFLGVIALLGGVQVAAIPLAAFLLALAVGLLFHRRIGSHAKSSTAAINRRLGVLAEAVEGAEAVKATGAGWQLLNRWNALSREGGREDMLMRESADRASQWVMLLQHASYTMLVCVGAFIALEGNLTMGAIVACSLLSARVLTPAGQLSGLLMQWGQAKAALSNLDRVYLGQTDGHKVQSAAVPAAIKGNFRLRNIRFAYPGRTDPLVIDLLTIEAGRTVGIMGGVGAGKSTLLKLLAGVYKPQRGQVLLEGLDIQQLSRAFLSEHIGYMPQEVRLFSGTLRDNLTFGLPAVSDADVLNACETSGLMQLISGHAQGLDLMIGEGGSGVSSGQKQLVALTRLLIARPKVLLLDEPTSAMDEVWQARTTAALRAAVSTLQIVLVTNKPALLALTDRLIVLDQGRIVADGPQDLVLRKLEQINNSL